MKLSVKEIVLIGFFAAITAVLSPLSVNNPILPAVPFTLQTFIVFLSAVILGSKCGAYSQVVYILLGIIGLPVFAGGQSGFAVMAGPLGGFLLSFPAVAFIIGYAMESIKKISIVKIFGIMLAGLAVCYVIGTVWLSLTTKIGLVSAFNGMLLFIPADAFKLLLASIVGYQVRLALIKAGLIQVS
ncbi:MAG: biotin transporter BioY [Bacillota bacterium]|nr:biotin transporter BioY [Bacillota bacterium]